MKKSKSYEFGEQVSIVSNIWLPHHHRMIRFLLEPSGSSFSSGINVLAKAQVAALCGHTSGDFGDPGDEMTGACLGGMTSNPDGRSIWVCLKIVYP